MANKVLHKKSVKLNSIPSGTTLDYGEIAVNYNEQSPFLSIRTSGATTENYVKFIDETAISDLVSKSEGELQGQIDEINKIVEENELVTANALNMLNSNINNLFETKAEVEHDHDELYYSKEVVDKKLEEFQQAGDYAPIEHDHVSGDITDSIAGKTGITASATQLVQGKAVYEYVDDVTSGFCTTETFDETIENLNKQIVETYLTIGEYREDEFVVANSLALLDNSINELSYSKADVVSFVGEGGTIVEFEDDGSIVISSHPEVKPTESNGDNTTGTEITIPVFSVNEYGHVESFGTKKHTITKADLGLSVALNYCGTTTTELVDGSTTNPVIINGNNHNAVAGCVVFYGDKEFIYNGSVWEEFGYPVDLSGYQPKGEYKTVQTAVTTATATTGNATSYVDAISQNTNGVISYTKKTIPTANTSTTGLMSSSDKTKLDGVATGATKVEISNLLTGGTKLGTITINGKGTDLYCNNDTKYKLCVGPTTEVTSNVAANGNVFLNLIENGISTYSHKISGSQGINVTSDSNGNITITGTEYISLEDYEKDEKVVATALTVLDERLLVLEENSIPNISRSLIVSSGSTITTGSSVPIGNGNVYLNYIEDDAVTSSINVVGSGGTGVLYSDGKIIIGSIAPDHNKTTITAGTAGTANDVTGSTITIPYVTFNADGHATGYGTKTHSIPLATAAARGLMSSSDKTKLDGVATDATKVEISNTLSEGNLLATIKVTNNSGISTSNINVPTGDSNNLGIVRLVEGDLSVKTSGLAGYAASEYHNHDTMYATKLELEEDEEVIAGALTDLDDRVNDLDDRLLEIESYGGGIMGSSYDGGSITYLMTSVISPLSGSTTGVTGNVDGNLVTHSIIHTDVTVQESAVFALNGFYQTSDETLKDFHGDIDVDFDKLKEIPKQYYSWKDKEDKEETVRQLGTSAQKLRNVYPELVNETNGKLQVDYARLSVVALKAVDMLHDENQMLKAILQEMDMRLKKLEDK